MKTKTYAIVIIAVAAAATAYVVGYRRGYIEALMAVPAGTAVRAFDDDGEPTAELLAALRAVPDGGEGT